MVKGQIRLHSKNIRNFQDIFFTEKMRIFFLSIIYLFWGYGRKVHQEAAYITTV